MTEAISKVRASHLKRDAYLYIRQSTVRQVFENSESTKRQYALRQRAVALGWPQERVRVIDCDLGRSGASTADREGFRKLVAEVGMGHAGIVLGLEVSRLARNCTDWHRLLEICALSDTLILDEDGLYNPNEFNDRLLLGLKGTMSEAELHLLRARLRGGLMNKARRGELVMRLPVGLVTDDRGRVRLDPDKQVRESVALFFETFRRTGSALATVRYFREEELLFPRRLREGPRKGTLAWGRLGHTGSLHMLHNPRYAGAFAFGRTRVRRRADGGVSIRKVPRDEWHVLIPGAHEGYISWEEYEDNQRRLRESAQAHGQDRRKSPPREGSALLQGIAVCGVCGRRMTVRYYANRSGTHPEYVCQVEGIRWGVPFCQRIKGAGIDAAVGELLLETLTPVALDVALAVQRELSAKLEEADRIRARQVERARYEADVAQRRFMKVDPGNRLVADVLEAEWNESLRAVQLALEEYERQRREDRMLVDGKARSRVMALAADFPRLWKDPKTSHRDRKRMVRLLVEDVTLEGSDNRPRALQGGSDPDHDAASAEVRRRASQNTAGVGRGDRPPPRSSYVRADRGAPERARIPLGGRQALHARHCQECLQEVQSEDPVRPPAREGDAHGERDGRGARRHHADGLGLVQGGPAPGARLQRQERAPLRPARARRPRQEPGMETRRKTAIPRGLV